MKKDEKLREEIGEESYREAKEIILQDTLNEIDNGRECPNRNYAGVFDAARKFYCMFESWGKEINCPYLGKEKVSVCIEVPDEEYENYLSKLIRGGKVRLERKVLERQGLVGKIKLLVGNLMGKLEYKRSKVPKKRNYVPSHMEDKLICNYIPLFDGRGDLMS